jgi:hypothetical protein
VEKALRPGDERKRDGQGARRLHSRCHPLHRMIEGVDRMRC